MFRQIYRKRNSEHMIVESDQDDLEALLLFREVNLMSLLNSSIFECDRFSQTNFENDPFSTIISKFATNCSLCDILNMEMRGISRYDWTTFVYEIKEEQKKNDKTKPTEPNEEENDSSFND